VCPPLVQGHIHLCQTLFRGMAESRTLLPWLSERVWPLEASHTPDTLAVSVIIGLRELFSSGCCGMLDMGSVEHTDVIAEILVSSGAHALLGNALMDRGPAFLARPLPWLQRETERIRGLCRGRVGYTFTPRFVLSCSSELWEWLSDQDPGVIRSTHSSEALAEMEEPAIQAAGGNVHLLDQLGFLGKGTVLAHCVHLKKGELSLLRNTGTAVAHCPWANLKLGSGIARVPSMVREGIQVFPASDGAGCNNGLDAACDVRLAMGLASVTGSPGEITAEKWFAMASAEAASFLGFDMKQDRVELLLSSREVDELCSSEEPWRYILELSWPGRVRKLICGGSVLFEDGHFPTLPPLPLSVGKAREKLVARSGNLS